MTSFIDFVRRIADSYLPSLVAHLWSSTVFLIVMLLVVLALRRRLTASARFALALIGILKFAVPGTVVVSAIKLVSGDFFPAGARGPLQMPLQVLGGALPFNPVSMTPGIWPGIVMTIWLAVAFVLMLRFSLSRHRLVSLSLRTALPPRSREVEALSRARRRIGVRRSIDIARSSLPEAPAVLRIFRPLVVLPTGGCDDLSDDELESLLCHECAHVARHDNLIARIESIICALFWFHPLIWIAQRVTVIERERACDEGVAGSADERDTYLAALAKFCQAAIAPRLPGVSCMASSMLKERMDHVMNYPTLKDHSPSPKRVTLLGTTALVLFTLSSGFMGNDRAFAGGTKQANEPYAIKLSATRAGDSIAVQGTVSENLSHRVVAASRFTVDGTHRGTMRTSGQDVEVAYEVRPDGVDRITVDVTIEKNGKRLQKNTLQVTPGDGEAAGAPGQFTGEPIDIDLKDADLRDVINMFGKLSGLTVQTDAAIQGKVSVRWHNVPWDQAFDSLLKDNGLTYRVEGKTIYVSKK